MFSGGIVTVFPEQTNSFSPRILVQCFLNSLSVLSGNIRIVFSEQTDSVL